MIDPNYEVVEDWSEPGQRGVFYYLDSGRVRGMVLWGVAGKLREARRLIRAGERRVSADWRGAIPA